MSIEGVRREFCSVELPGRAPLNPCLRGWYFTHWATVQVPPWYLNVRPHNSTDIMLQAINFHFFQTFDFFIFFSNSVLVVYGWIQVLFFFSFFFFFFLGHSSSFKQRNTEEGMGRKIERMAAEKKCFPNMCLPPDRPFHLKIWWSVNFT